MDVPDHCPQTVHALTEILTDDDCCVIITAVDTVDRIILRLYKLPANLVIFLQIVDNGITHDHKFAITLGISFIHRNNRNRYRSCIAVRIPVRIDIKPCIQDGSTQIASAIKSASLFLHNPFTSLLKILKIVLIFSYSCIYFSFLSSIINYNVFYH